MLYDNIMYICIILCILTMMSLSNPSKVVMYRTLLVSKSIVTNLSRNIRQGSPSSVASSIPRHHSLTVISSATDKCISNQYHLTFNSATFTRNETRRSNTIRLKYFHFFQKIKRIYTGNVLLLFVYLGFLKNSISLHFNNLNFHSFLVFIIFHAVITVFRFWIKILHYL